MQWAVGRADAVSYRMKFAPRFSPTNHPGSNQVFLIQIKAGPFGSME
jgi:hypothetical protein